MAESKYGSPILNLGIGWISVVLISHRFKILINIIYIVDVGLFYGVIFFYSIDCSDCNLLSCDTVRSCS
jgi:hypothetical protein